MMDEGTQVPCTVHFCTQVLVYVSVIMCIQSSAVKQRYSEVDASRIATWWHLIEKLQMSKAGSAKLRLFHTVSVFDELELLSSTTCILCVHVCVQSSCS